MTNTVVAYTIGVLNAHVGHTDPLSIYDHITHEALGAFEIMEDSFRCLSWSGNIRTTDDKKSDASRVALQTRRPLHHLIADNLDEEYLQSMRSHQDAKILERRD